MPRLTNEEMREIAGRISAAAERIKAKSESANKFARNGKIEAATQELLECNAQLLRLTGSLVGKLPGGIAPTFGKGRRYWLFSMN